MDVCYITDEKYVMPTCVSLISLRDNVSELIKAFIICDSVKPESKKVLQSIQTSTFETILIDAAADLQEYEDAVQELVVKTGTYVSKSALIKFDLANVLNDLKKVLYLDCDVVICKDISDLWNTDLEDNYVAAVNDMGDGYFLGDKHSDLAGRLGLDGGSYFNSGVMLLNLELMRHDSISEVLKNYRLNGTNYFMDQDALNYVLGAKRVVMSYKYNYMASLIYLSDFETYNASIFDNEYESISDCLDDQFIIHMSGPYKPWDYHIPYVSDIFDRYYSKSPYAKNTLHRDELIEKFFSKMIADSTMINELNQGLQKLTGKIEYLERCKSIMDWHFPTERIRPNSKVVLYGAGEIGKAFYNQVLESQYCTIVMWIDGKYNSNSDLDVRSPDEITDTEYDYLLIALSRSEDISAVKNQLERLEVMDNRVVTLFDIEK
jgi:lipopolysaccharide biosynthesis glycosyltransferase